MYLILLKIFLHDLVGNILPQSIKSVVGAKTRRTIKYNDEDCLLNWFIQSRIFSV